MSTPSWPPPSGYNTDPDHSKRLGAAPVYPVQQAPAYPPYPVAEPFPYTTPPPYNPYTSSSTAMPGQGVPPPSAPLYNQPQTNMYGTGAYGEDPIPNAAAFDDQSIRRGFIRKVYLILMAQLLVTTSIIAIFTYHKPTNLYVRGNVGLFYGSFAVVIVTIICMSCCVSVRRKTPTNFIFLGLFTLAESLMLGCAAASFQKEEVVMAAGITALVCFSLSIFALQTKWDFTILGGALFVAVIILFIFGIVAAFFPGKTVTIAYASCGALLFSMYLIYDTQMMMGGKHKHSISPEEYIFAALNLYLDIINIFLYILTIISASKD